VNRIYGGRTPLVGVFYISRFQNPECGGRGEVGGLGLTWADWFPRIWARGVVHLSPWPAKL
jgi:hypothetical protein